MKKPNLVIFGMESLDRHHMSMYGYHRLTTPHLADIAAGGTVFEKCFSPSIPTSPGYATMLTGRDCFGTDVVALRHKGDIAPGVPTLAEVLRGEGYNTTCVGFDGNPASRGFDTYLNFAGWGSYEEGRSPKAENLNAVTLPELERLAAADQPFFLFLRHMDPHSPYLAPEPFASMFYQGDAFDPANKSLEPVMDFKPFRDYFASWFPPGCTDKDYIIAQYDAEIAYMDACIRILMEKMDALGLLEDTLLVFTSDHGETLHDHECWYDHHGLYDCTLSVPLFFRFSGRVPEGVRVKDACQLKDIMPTVLSLLGIEKDMEFEGKNLVTAMEGQPVGEESFYITECTWMRKHGWRTPKWKLIRALEPDFHFKPEIELYDLEQDPGENQNLAEARPDIVEELTRQMENHIAKREAATGRRAPIYTNTDWHGLGVGPFTSSQQAYDSMHIGDPGHAQRLQAGKKS